MSDEVSGRKNHWFLQTVLPVLLTLFGTYYFTVRSENNEVIKKAESQTEQRKANLEELHKALKSLAFTLRSDDDQSLDEKLKVFSDKLAQDEFNSGINKQRHGPPCIESPLGDEVQLLGVQIKYFQALRDLEKRSKDRGEASVGGLPKLILASTIDVVASSTRSRIRNLDAEACPYP